jgi:hypothetical protein
VSTDSSTSPASWEPTTEHFTGVFDAANVGALAAMLDDGLPPPQPGEPLPLRWHWAALSRWVPSGRLGADGHERTGSFMPPVEASRRMFAGTDVRVHVPLRVDEDVEVQRTVTSVSRKHGRSGRLTLVTVEQRISNRSGRLALVEEQHLAYVIFALPNLRRVRVPCRCRRHHWWLSLRTRGSSPVLVSAAVGLDRPIGRVATVIGDDARLRATTRVLKAAGFGAWAIIHPKQIQRVEEAFRPSPTELRVAIEIVEAVRQSAVTGSAVVPDPGGRMIDAPVAAQAEALLAEHQAELE